MTLCLLWCVSSPLDEVIDKLGGPDHVAEMTGRRWRVVRQTPSGSPTLQLRDSSLEAPSSSNSSSSGGLDTLNVYEVLMSDCLLWPPARQLCWPPAILLYHSSFFFSLPNLRGHLAIVIKFCHVFESDPDL